MIQQSIHWFHFFILQIASLYYFFIAAGMQPNHIINTYYWFTIGS
jgi:hypothetical protein